jgi:ribose transport system substrate-binding protein
MAIVTWNTDGVEAFVAENPGIELVQTAYANWDPAQALAATEDMLLAHPDLAGVYVISEVMTQGVIQALEAQGLSDQVKIISGGYAPESQEWLANGEIIAAFEWSSYAGGQAQMQRIYDHLKDGTEPPGFSALVVYVHTPDGEPFEIDCPIGDWSP